MIDVAIHQIAQELRLARGQVAATVGLLDDGGTVPFIARYRKEQTASLDEVAAALHMSARSLRRKLDAEGSSYRAVLEEARRQMADQLLRSTTMKIEEMAVHLGYADTASFTRAFRRWHGASPGQYREQLRTP